MSAFLWTNNASAQEKLSTKDKISIKEANGAFISGDYISAIRIYKTAQAKDLSNGVDILVATPGRLFDLALARQIKLKTILSKIKSIS